MRLLAFETLGPSLSATVFDDARPLATQSSDGHRNQAERLLPLLDGLLAEVGWDWPAIDLLAVDVGPGGFTAVRTGLAAARALALAIDRPALGVSSLEAVAAGAERAVVATKDLRRGQLAFQRFDIDARPVDRMRLAGMDELRDEIADGEWLTGDGAALLAAVAGRHLPMVEVPLDARYVGSAALRRLAEGAEPVPGIELRPVYLRAPDAALAAGRALVAGLAEP